MNSVKEKINQVNQNTTENNTENENINNYNNNKSNNNNNNNNNNSNIDNNIDNNNKSSNKKFENIEIIKGKVINSNDINSTTENNSSYETLALNNSTDNNNNSSIENQKYFNSLVNTEKESLNKFVYKLIDEDIINEEYYLDINDTIDNIINNKPYVPKNVIDYKSRELYTLIHDKNLRKKYFNNTELRLCPLVL